MTSANTFSLFYFLTESGFPPPIKTCFPPFHQVLLVVGLPLYIAWRTRLWSVHFRRSRSLGELMVPAVVHVTNFPTVFLRKCWRYGVQFVSQISLFCNFYAQTTHVAGGIKCLPFLSVRPSITTSIPGISQSNQWHITKCVTIVHWFIIEKHLSYCSQRSRSLGSIF